MLKKIAIVVVVLILIGAGGAWYLFSNLDSIVKAAIEKYGSAATQATVTVDSVKISVATGEGTISGIKVGNPSGFASQNALSLGSITVKLDANSALGSGPIVVTGIEIVQPQVTYDVGSDGGSNLLALEKNTQAYVSSLGASSPSSGQARRMIINDLNVRDGQVNISATVLQGRSLSVPLPAIHIARIGNDGGATPAQITEQVVSAISKKAIKAGAAGLKEYLTSVVGGLGKGLTRNAHGVGGQLTGLLGH